MKMHRVAIGLLIVTAGSDLQVIPERTMHQAVATESPGSEFPRFKHIQFSFTIRNASNQILEKAELWSFAPAKQTSTQRSVTLESSWPFEVIVDPLGNQILHFTWYDLPPNAIKVITVKAGVSFSQMPIRSRATCPTVFLSSELYIETDDPELGSLARTLAGDKHHNSTVKNIFRWTVENIAFADYTRDDRGAIAALRKRRADCTDLAYLVAALCRANRIPARAVGGYVLSDSASLHPNQYHNWAEVYVDGSWRIVDAHRRVCMEAEQPYLAMRIAPLESQNPLAAAHRFIAVGDGLKVRMH